MKMIMGILQPDEGNITIGDTVKIGYFAQENEDMTGDIRVIDYIRNVAEYIQTTKGQASSPQMPAQMPALCAFSTTIRIIARIAG